MVRFTLGYVGRGGASVGDRAFHILPVTGEFITGQERGGEIPDRSGGRPAPSGVRDDGDFEVLDGLP
ncbi:hypothetical protein CEB94_01900 [Streptomyces hawaiiensis]|uniref:Uncharacterized protein n=1 Tax=Streptomyces hawaiiensis TaxID=67305 RepID=A0A6G5R732_9ACTN|nr:hypothetical protein CEB94_01900 [Streptomyces hawaiiensis]